MLEDVASSMPTAETGRTEDENIDHRFGSYRVDGVTERTYMMSKRVSNYVIIAAQTDNMMIIRNKNHNKELFLLDDQPSSSVPSIRTPMVAFTSIPSSFIFPT